MIFKGVLSGSLSPNGVPSSKAAVSNEDTKVLVDYVNDLKQGSQTIRNYVITKYQINVCTLIGQSAMVYCAN